MEVGPRADGVAMIEVGPGAEGVAMICRDGRWSRGSSNDKVEIEER
jgi:hypothetical protein